MSCCPRSQGVRAGGFNSLCPPFRPTAEGCQQPPCYHQFCRADIINRNCLSRCEHTDLLATPKGFCWDLGRPMKGNCRCKMYQARHRCDAKMFPNQCMTEVWNLLTPEMIDKLRDMLMEEFGMTEKEAETFIEQQRHKSGKKARCCCPKRKCGVGPRLQWAKDLGNVLANKFTDYIVKMLCVRRTKKMKCIAEHILKQLCDISGEECTLSNPQTRIQRIMVFAADRLAIWLSHIYCLCDGKKPCKSLGPAKPCDGKGDGKKKGGDGPKEKPQKAPEPPKRPSKKEPPPPKKEKEPAPPKKEQEPPKKVREVPKQEPEKKVQEPPPKKEQEQPKKKEEPPKKEPEPSKKEPEPPKKEPEPPKKEPEPPKKEPEPPKKEPEPPKKEPEPPKKEPEPPKKEPEPPKKGPEPPKKEPEPTKKEPEPPKKGPEPPKKEPEAPKKEPEPPKKAPEPSKKEPEPPKKEPEPEPESKKDESETQSKKSCESTASKPCHSKSRTLSTGSGGSKRSEKKSSLGKTVSFAETLDDGGKSSSKSSEKSKGVVSVGDSGKGSGGSGGVVVSDDGRSGGDGKDESKVASGDSGIGRGTGSGTGSGPGSGTGSGPRSGPGTGPGSGPGSGPRSGPGTGPGSGPGSGTGSGGKGAGQASVHSLRKEIMEQVSDWVEDTVPEKTERQTLLQEVISNKLKSELDIDEDDDEVCAIDEAIDEVSCKLSTWLDQMLEEAEQEGRSCRKGVTYHIKRCDGSYYDVKKMNSREVCESTYAARLENAYLNRPRNVNTCSPREKVEWAKWAAGVVKMAEKWANWIDSTCAEMTKRRQGGYCPMNREEYCRWKLETEVRAREFRQRKAELKEVAKLWNEKAAKCVPK